MILQFLDKRTNTTFPMEHPTILPGYKGDATMEAFLTTCPDQRTMVNLSYSASVPDMFALVTSVLQQLNEPEAITDWDSQSTSFPPSWTMDLEDCSRYSSLFPRKIWAPVNQTNTVESWSSEEEKLGEVSATELRRKKHSWPLPGPPCSPPSHEVLKPFDPQNNDLNRQSNIIPECSNAKKQVYILQRDHFASQVWAEFYGGHQESIAGGGLGASDKEKPIRLSHAATYGIWQPIIQENDLCDTRGTYKSPQSMSPLFSLPFQQENSVPEAANTDLHQPNCPNNPYTDNVQSKNLRCPLQDSTNCLPPPSPGFQYPPPGFQYPPPGFQYPPPGFQHPPPGFQHPPPGFQHPPPGFHYPPPGFHYPPPGFQYPPPGFQYPPPGFQYPPPGFHSSYSGDKCLKSRSLNPSEASCVLYKNPIMPMYTQPPESYGHGFVVQSFGSQTAPQRFHYLQDGEFPSGGGNQSSIRHSWVDRQAPEEEPLGEILTNTSFHGWPQRPPKNKFAKCHGSDSDPDGGHAGQRTGQIESWDKMNPSFVNRDWTPLPALRNFHAFHPHPSFSADVHNDIVHRLTHVINDLCGGASALYRPSLLQHHYHRLATNDSEPACTLYVHLGKCFEQWQMLERERAKTEADLARAFPSKSFTSSSNITGFPLPANPSHVDYLIWIQFQERSRVCILLEKMEHFGGISIHNNILASLERHLEAIYTTQARHNDEILNADSPQRPGTSSEILALASALDELTSSTRKTRTALWCVIQHIVFPKIWTRVPDENASIPLKTKALTEGEDKENKRVN